MAESEPPRAAARPSLPAADTTSATAYLDESARVAKPGFYFMSAVIVATDRSDAVRSALTKTHTHPRRPFHWRLEEHADQERMASAVGALDLPSTVVVATPLDPRRTERARRRCLARLLWELQTINVTDVVLESRGHQDTRDRQLIASEIRSKRLGENLTYAFGRPREEPLLWLPDLVAGAVNQARSDDLDCCLELLGPMVRVVEIGTAI